MSQKVSSNKNDVCRYQSLQTITRRKGMLQSWRMIFKRDLWTVILPS